MLDQTAVPHQGVAYHIDWLIPCSAAHIEGVAAQPSEQLGIHVLVRALDKVCIVPFHGIHGRLLDAAVTDIKAGSPYTVIRNYEVVAEFSAHHCYRVKPFSPFDSDRRVHRVFDEVGALSAVDVGKGCLGIVRIHLDKGPDTENVVVLISIQEKFRLVVVHVKGVIPYAAVHSSRVADAVAQVSPGSQRGREPVLRGQPVIRVGCITGRLEYLPDLELIVARVPVNRNR